MVDPELPPDGPRYLRGVGVGEDVSGGGGRGMALVDCGAPTRMGRNGRVCSSDGRHNVKRAEWRSDAGPLDAACRCTVCARFSRGYLRHLYVSDEILGLRLLSLHNVHFLVTLMRNARDAIQAGGFEGWARDWLERLASRPETTP